MVGVHGTVGGRRKQAEQRVGTRCTPRTRCNSCSPAVNTKPSPHSRHTKFISTSAADIVFTIGITARFAQRLWRVSLAIGFETAEQIFDEPRDLVERGGEH
jgi:hypothetical protein